VYPWVEPTLLKIGSYGKLTLPGVLGVNHWVVIIPLVVLGGAFLFWLDRREVGAGRSARAEALRR